MYPAILVTLLGTVPRIDEIIAGKDGPVFSFEFFPPKSDEGEANLRQGAARAEPARSRLRVGDLRRGRDDPRPDGGHRRVAAPGVRPGGDGALHVRQRHRRRPAHDARTACATPGSRTSSRCAATRRRAQDRWTQTEGGLEHSQRARRAASRRSTTSRSARPASRRPTSTRSTRRPTCATSRRRSTPARGSSSRSSSSRTRHYDDFVARARDAGIDVPIIPGIMPITNVSPDQADHRAVRVGDPGPPALRAGVARRRAGGRRRARGGLRDAAVRASCSRNGAPGVHFYTLNRSPSTRAILGALRLMRPWERTATPV